MEALSGNSSGCHEPVVFLPQCFYGDYDYLWLLCQKRRESGQGRNVCRRTLFHHGDFRDAHVVHLGSRVDRGQLRGNFPHRAQKTVLVLCVIYLAASAVIALGYGVFYFELPLPNGSVGQLLDRMDYISNSVMMFVLFLQSTGILS